jgi:LysM repeat protein
MSTVGSVTEPKDHQDVTINEATTDTTNTQSVNDGSNGGGGGSDGEGEIVTSVTHRVKEGDTLEGIAGSYGTTPEEIEKANAGKIQKDDENHLVPGQTLTIPVKAAVERVDSGEDLWKISEKYASRNGIDTAQLWKATIEFNEAQGLADPDQLKAGSRIYVPATWAQNGFQSPTIQPLAQGSGGIDPDGKAQEAATGAEAAARLQNRNNYFKPEWRRYGYTEEDAQAARANDFAATIERHKDDSAFLAEMYKSLGPETTASLLADATKLAQGTTTDGHTVDAKKAVAQALTATPKEVNDKFVGAATQDGTTAKEAAKVLAQMPAGATTETLKSAFLEQIVKDGRALGKAGDYFSQRQRAEYAQAAQTVIGSDPKLAEKYKAQQPELTRNAAFSPAAQSGPVDRNGRAVEARNGAEAAARLLNEQQYPTADWERIRANDFAATIYKHKDDQQFLTEMFKALGPEKTAEIVNKVPLLQQGEFYDDNDQLVQFDATSTVAQGLALADHNLPAEFDARFAQAAAKDAGSAIGVSLVLSKMDPQPGTQIQRAFLDEVLKDGRALGTPASDHDRGLSYLYARAAGQVLGSNAALAHEYLGVGGKLSFDQLKSLTDNALYLPANGSAYGPALSNKMLDGFERAFSILPGEDFQALVKNHPEYVDQLTSRLAQETVSGASPTLHYLVQAASHMPDKKLVADSFYKFAHLMRDPQIGDKLTRNAPFRDAMAELFAGNVPNIIAAGIRPGSQAGLTSDAQLALGHFARKEFFTVPIGEPQLKALDAYTGYMNQIATDLRLSTPGPDANLLADGIQQPTLTADQFRQKWGLSRENAARVLGSMSGVLELGLRASINDIKSGISLIDWNNRTWAGIITESARRVIQNLAPELLAKNPIGAGALAVFFKATGFYVTQLTEGQKKEALDKAVNDIITQFRSNPEEYVKKFHEQYAQGLSNENGDTANKDYLIGYLEAANNDDLLSLFNMK